MVDIIVAGLLCVFRLFRNPWLGGIDKNPKSACAPAAVERGDAA